MIPVVVGIAALAAWALSGCGPGAKTTQDLNDDAGTDAEVDNRVRNTGGTGGSGGTAGTGAVAGSGGVSGNAGAAGMDGDMDAGVEDAGADAFIPDQESVAYHFGMIYGSNPFVGVNGTGNLYFSNQDSCQLLGGSFQAETQTGDQFAMSIDLAGNQSVDFCSAEFALPLAGGVFEGMTWMLTNKSSVLSDKEGYEITSCGSQEDGGTGLEKCSGALNISNP